MILPSSVGGAATQEVGYMERPAEGVAAWFLAGMSSDWKLRAGSWPSFEQALSELVPSAPMSRYAFIPNGGWTLVLNNGPLGTDVGVLPSLAAREWGCVAVRAVCVEDDGPGFPARILSVFGPDGTPPLLSVRSIAAANDGGRWVFETSGEPLPFERMVEYDRRRKTDRFTSGLLYEYLRQLHVPIDVEPDWANAVIIERRLG